MKRILIAAAFAIIAMASCGTGDEPTPDDPNNPDNPNPTPSVAASHWIPNWESDTLVGWGNNPNATNAADNLDIIYSIKRGDTSLIEYNGVEYYVWAQCPFTNPEDYPDWWGDNKQSYVWVCIASQPFDTGSAIIFSALNSVMPSKYYNENYNEWHDQEQVMLLNPKKPPFPSWVYMGSYSTENKSLLP